MLKGGKMPEITEKKWTKGQSAAIDIHGKTLLVSAAAGSGKTATLTERIIKSLTDKDQHADISKMLIVTFTRAAAGELKDRIFKALSNALSLDPVNRHLNEQLIKLGSAKICTIDSFYLDLIRQNFSSLGISASCRIADTNELDILKKTVMDEVIDKRYDSDENFPRLAECFIGTRSINRLSDPMIELYDEVISYPEGIEFLKLNADQLNFFYQSETDFLQTPYGILLKSELAGKFDFYLKLLKQAFNYSCEFPDIFSKRAATYENDTYFIEKVISALASDNSNFSSLREIFRAYSPDKMGSAKGSDETPESIYFKEQRKAMVDGIKDIRERIFSRDDATLRNEMKATAENIEKLYSLLCDFSEKLTEEKNRRGIMDFDDIRRYTLKLLVTPDGKPTEIAQKYSEQFSDIYIDEYQDVDRVQDMIFRSISKDNRFMVGDIKQSIYGFRGAEPQVFADYKQSFFNYDPEAPQSPSDSTKEMTIFMSENFRCDENIIKFTNLVCSRIFASCAKSIGYTEADDLRFSKKKPTDNYVSPTVNVSVIITSKADDDEASENEAEKKKRRKKKDDEPTAEELEAEYIASEIEALIGKEKKADGSLIVPGDIAILYRSGKMVACLSDALKKRNILCSEGGGDEYFESPDVLLVLSLLNTVDNPHRDIHLAGTLCSPLFEFSLDDLIKIRLSASSSCSLYDAVTEYSLKDDTLAEKCRNFEEILQGLRKSSTALPVDRFLRILFESDIFTASGLLSDRNDYGEGGNLLRLYDYARTFESGSFKGLYNFIEFINTLIENGQVLEVAPKDRCPERVTLSTMHHSKGLEFPVCFICGTGKKKNMSGIHKSLLCEYPTGLAMKLSDSTGFARISTPLRQALSVRKLERELEEEMRILYVAMTRARERLYITGCSKQDEDKLLLNAEIRNAQNSDYAIKHCNTFLDWILLPFANEKINSDCATLSFIYPEEYCVTEDVSDGEAFSENTVASDIEADPALYRQLREKFSFRYKYADLVRIPAKLSVSRLSPDVLDEDDGALELFESDKKAEIPDFFLTDKPSRASATERGTATHLFLQFCDLKNARKNGVAEELARLTENRFIPENVSELIYLDELERFIHSELADKMLSSERIIREQRFNLLLPASDFTSENEAAILLKDEILAVQGVIDLITVDKNGDIDLYDYKTDRLTRDELASDQLAKSKMNELHGMQLSYYAKAVRELFGKDCRRVCVYSTHAAKLYDIDVTDLKLSEIK